MPLHRYASARDTVKPFYTKGLKFECTRCSRCCRFTPGYVFLSHQDLRRIAQNHKINQEQARERYCRVVDVSGFKRLSLKEKPNLDCIFWADGICTIYEARPLQCQSFPFWSSTLESERTWESAAVMCPGIGKGSVHTKREIESWLRKRRSESLISMNGETQI